MSFYRYKRSVLRLAILNLAVLMSISHPRSALADNKVVVPAVVVEGERLDQVSTHSDSFGESVEQNVYSGLRTNDSARLLDQIPGLSFYTGGGVSSLPVIDGLADDRLSIKVDGIPITSACPNHMNPALSYATPVAIGRIDVVAGITPVSKGGDSIGGSISVVSPKVSFANAGEATKGGSITGFYRGNGNVRGGNVQLRYATDTFGAEYIGSIVSARDYKDGDGNKVRATEYESRNHLIKLAARSGEHTIGLNIGWQEIPYQGYPNQAMDMTHNQSVSFNLSYDGSFDWGKLEARAYRQNVNHEMDMLADKLAVVGNMPMDTRAVDVGYALLATIPLSVQNELKIGNEFHRYTLDDWWPPIAGSMMMGPNTFWNINNGRRDRMALFGELNSKWSDAWSTQFGARVERVSMNAGNVQGYYDTGESMMFSVPDGSAYKADADAFNSRSHKKVDYNWDLTATSRFEPSDTSRYDIGFARKTRSPNMHERYTWANEAMMAGFMNNWFGDLNSYVGNLNLNPEVANSIRATADWHDAASNEWFVKLSPFYTYVHDYINAVPNPSTNPFNMSMIGRRSLTFANHNAHLYGLDISAKKALGDWNGNWDMRTIIGYVRGKDNQGSNLYNIMPLNGKFYLDHHLGGWSNSLELVVVAPKDKLDAVRDEQRTSGYALLNFQTAYQFNKNFRLNAGVENVLDKNYAYPLGGLDYLKTFETGSMMSPYTPVSVNAMGRSANVALTFDF